MPKLKSDFFDYLELLHKRQASFRFWNGFMFGCCIGQWCTIDHNPQFFIVSGFWVLGCVMCCVRCRQTDKAYTALEKSTER